MRRLLWSESALEDFDQVIAYVATDNPTAARKVANRIDDTARKLADRPTGRRGRVGGTYEKLVVGLPYILAYAIEMLPSGDEVIVILRVVHGARNWPPEQWPD